MLPLPRRVFRNLFFTLLLANLVGCSSMPGFGTETAASDSPSTTEVATVPQTPEEEVLAALDGAAAGAPILTSGGVSATGDEPYAAASGRSCRWVNISYPASGTRRQLACRQEGRWQWVSGVSAVSGQ